MSTEYYDILGVKKTATETEIRKAFRALSLTHHPDKGGDEEYYKKIRNAYDTLSDAKKRQHYDTFGTDNVDHSDILGNMFGNMGGVFNFFKQAHNFIRQAPPIIHTYEVSLEDICTRKVIKLRFERQQQCCNKYSECDACKGSGFTVHHQSFGPFVQQIRSQCHNCQGSGKVYSSCSECKNGLKTTKKDIHIHLTPDMENGYKYVVQKEGNHPHGSEAGDIVVILNHCPHPVFKVRNRDLIMTHVISLVDALCGCTITIQHPSGETIEVTQNIILQPDIITTVKQKGLTEDGNLEINYRVSYPTELSSEQKINLRRILN